MLIHGSQDPPQNWPRWLSDQYAQAIAAWLSVLEAGYVVFLLQPHHQSFGKRLVKTPTLHFHEFYSVSTSNPTSLHR
jgi:hypothetical protein